MTMTISFAWYDLWIGIYIDRARRAVYVCPLPCLVLKFQRRKA